MKEHPVYSGYFVTPDGRVFSNRRKQTIKELNQTLVNDYLSIIVYHNGRQIRKSVHRLVAETYLPNPNNLPQVNHIDENKINNNLNNLEWVTHQQNAEHSLCKKTYFIQDIKTLKEYFTNNLNKWCNERGLQSGALLNTYTNNVKKAKQHKGYKILLIT